MDKIETDVKYIVDHMESDLANVVQKYSDIEEKNGTEPAIFYISTITALLRVYNVCRQALIDNGVPEDELNLRLESFNKLIAEGLSNDFSH